MRKLVVLFAIFAVFVGGLAAQAQLPQPDPPTLKISSGIFPGCVQIKWRTVELADGQTYEVRLTKVGKGRLKYAADSNPARRNYGWNHWQNIGGYLARPGRKVFVATQCGLEPGQKIKGRIRLVDSEGAVGPSSKASIAFVTP